jgi:glucosamine kinase
MVEFLVGVDGGGSGTRVLLARRDGGVIGRGSAGPSALSRGAAPAWAEIGAAIAAACADAGVAPVALAQCAVGAGLSGVNHRPWRDAFVAADPGYARLELDTDAHTMLLGAHAGRHGAIVAAGTGSVGEAWLDDGSHDGTRASVGGWGFPIGDEGSGAWLGWHAMRHAMHAFDGRARGGALADAVRARCGRDADALIGFCAASGQFEFAQLAPLVFDAEASDPAAAALLAGAASAIEAMADALDPDGRAPLAVSGSVGMRLVPRLAERLRARLVDVADGADAGALTLIRRALAAAH